MIVDASALLAVLFEEPEGARLAAKIAQSPVCRMSAVSYVEAAIVADSRLGSRAGLLDHLIESAEISVEPVTPEQAKLVRIAYRRFGKGNHPARLNMGDCFSYALSRITGEPLLFKGDDFSQTDIGSA